ncbi:hypothetical protein [Nereida ignava]|uniref:hypothetical protein n=1 Tax=Nereida ignava TaxID=282199 RepID=UPI0030FCBCBC
MTSRNWIFTINNPTQKNHDAVMDMTENEKCLSMKAETELGAKEGTPHIQGAIQWDNNISPAQCRKRLGGGCWVSKARGTWEDQDYCNKDPVVLPDGHQYCINFGDGWKGQGTRSELQQFREDIDADMDEERLLEAHIPTIARYPQLEKRLRAARLKEKTRAFRTVRVEIIWGDAGTNKSRDQIYDKKRKRGDNFIVPNTANLKWWDGYDGEETIVIEDFEGSRTCTVDRFKRLLDGHQLMLEVKGGQTYAAWTTVRINSNLDPASWYDMADGYEKDGLFRLFDSIEKRTQKSGLGRGGAASASSE